MNLKLLSLFGYQSLTDIIVYQAHKKITLQQFISEVIYLDKILPSHQHLLNLYENRYYFLLGLVLGLKRNSVQLFPSNTTDHTLSFLEKKYADILVLNDTSINLKNAHYLNIKKLLSEKDNNLASSTRLNNSNQKTIMQDSESFLNHHFVTLQRIIIFTSGSTGDPQPFTKNWNDFIDVAKQLGRQIGKQEANEDKPMVLATVPAQHMYGLEASIMSALVNGLSIYDERPFYPADISAIVNKQARSTLLISTPIHIRACLKTQVNLPFLKSCLSATAPLDYKLADAFEKLYKTPLIEIYGCTEVGVIALRQPSLSERWNCLNDIALKQSTDHEYYIKTTRSIDTFILNDYISELIVNNKENSFLLNGRKEDMINLAGKRTSVCYLNHHLLTNVNIKDGCFYQPDKADDVHQRLVVFVVLEKKLCSGSSLNSSSVSDLTKITKELKNDIKDKVDSVFLPRKYYFINHLPRNKSGKLLYNDLKYLYHKLIN